MLAPMTPSPRRRRRRAWLLAVAIVAALAVMLGRRPFVIAFEGSGLDPSIPAELRVPPTIDPELAEHTALFAKKVWKVGDSVYCAVGFGLANIVFVEGTDGVLVVDTGESKDQAAAVLAEIRKITPKPIAGVVLTHHHADHVLGTSVFVSPEDAASGRVPIFGHSSLVKRYVDETGVTAELQAVRSLHMYGGALGPADRQGSNAGIGPFLGRGESGFLAPTRTVDDRLEVTVAGIRLDLRYVPSEAESEIAAYLPDRKILLSAEVVQDHTLPNVYTIRGARYRDPLAWVRSLDLLRSFEAEAMVLQHGPPVLGRDEVARVLTQYRDQIQFIHDQTVRFMNHGLPPEELAARVKLPEHLAGVKPWGRPYYGTVSQAVKNVYGGYEGWFQGDPVALDPTPPAELARRLVTLMGGRDKVIAEAKRTLGAGETQFASELATMLVRIDPKDMEARHVKASALRRQAYAQRNASWRNYKLVSAMELDDQLPSFVYLHEAAAMLGPALAGLPAESQVALLPVRLKAEDALDQDLFVGLRFTDENTDFSLHLRRGVLEVAHGTGDGAGHPVVALAVTRASLGACLGGASYSDAIDRGVLKVTVGEAAVAKRFFGLFEVPFTEKPEVVVR